MSLPAEFWLEEEGEVTEVRSETIDSTELIGDLQDFLEEALFSLETVEL